MCGSIRWSIDTPAGLHAELGERINADDRYGQKRRPFYMIWPTDYPVITQRFGANPQIYSRFGVPAHEGLDIRALTNTNIYSCFDGAVMRSTRTPRITLTAFTCASATAMATERSTGIWRGPWSPRGRSARGPGDREGGLNRGLGRCASASDAEARWGDRPRRDILSEGHHRSDAVHGLARESSAQVGKDDLLGCRALSARCLRPGRRAPAGRGLRRHPGRAA